MPALKRLVLLTAFVAFASAASAESWHLRLDEDNIVVESRVPDDKDYQEFRATVEINAPVLSAIALLKDNDACSQWLFRCAESRLIEEISHSERLFYQRTKLPFPARDRDAIFHAVIEFDETGAATVMMTSQPEAEPETGYVRIEDAYGSYRLVPTSDTTSRVTWQQYVDPAGALPRWLVNSMLTDLPYRSLLVFRELVLEPPYRNARLIYDEAGSPVGITTD